MGDSDSNKKADEVIGGIDPNAFDAQMLLLDIYLQNIPGLKIISGPHTSGKSSNNVPYLPKGFDSVNALCGLSRGGILSSINSFIQNITPLEAAMIYPKIKLQIIDHNSDGVFDIPLGPVGSSGVSGNSRSRTFRRTQAQSGFYVRNEVGLNSLSLELDGRDLTFFGKSYIVTMKLTFDSVNTFTSPIYGSRETLGYPVTFAQVFRSSGVVGVEQFYTRLSISYSSNNEEIIEKYALNMPEMKFNLMMDLTEAKFTMEENLKVSIEATYQSRAEALYNSNLVFDFLGLDLLTAEQDKRREVDTAEEAIKILDKKKEEYVKATQEAVMNNPGYKELDSKYHGIKDDNEYAAAVQRGEKSLLGVDGSSLFEFQRYRKARDAISKKKLEKGWDDAEDTKALVQSANERKKAAIQALANIRHTQLTKAISETFPFFKSDSIKKGVVSTVYLNSKQIFDYYNQSNLTDSKKKDLKKEESAKKSSDPGVSTVQVKAKPKEGDKSDGGAASSDAQWWDGVLGTSKKEKSISNYEKDVNAILTDLGNQKQIDYVMFGDIMRLVYERLYTILPTQAKKLDNINLSDSQTMEKLKKSLEKTILLFSEISFESFEDAVKNPGNLTTREKNLYDLPISTKNLRYILAKRLYGQQHNYFTIFQLMEELIQLISLTRKRKAQVLNNQSAVSNFTLKKMTYPLEYDFDAPAGSGAIYKINTDDTVPVEEIFNGMLIYIKRAKDNKPIKASKLLSPRFIFGGAPTGIIKKFTVSEIADSDLQKLVMEQLRGDNDQVIPSFFEVTIKSIMAPFFQLGMQINVSAPTLESAGASSANLFLAGDYQVQSITHDFSAGKSFDTTIKATLYNSDKKSTLKSRGLSADSGFPKNIDETALVEYNRILAGETGQEMASDILKQNDIGTRTVVGSGRPGDLSRKYVGGKI